MDFFFSFWIHAWVYLRFLGISVLSQKTHGVLWKEWLYLSYKVYDCTSATNFQCSRFNLLFVFYMNEQEHYLQTHLSPFLPLVHLHFCDSITSGILAEWKHTGWVWDWFHLIQIITLEAIIVFHILLIQYFALLSNIVHYGCYTIHKHLHTKDIWLFIISFSTNKHKMNNQKTHIYFNFHVQDWSWNSSMGSFFKISYTGVNKTVWRQPRRGKPFDHWGLFWGHGVHRKQ